MGSGQALADVQALDVIDVNERPAGAPARPWRRWRRSTAFLLGNVMLLNACYTTRPAAGPPAPGSRVVIELNDQGRAAYGERIGPSAREVEGVVQSAGDSAVVLRIASIRRLSGQNEGWVGEQFTFAPANISSVRTRELSRQRTALVTVAAVAAVAVLFLTAKLVGNAFGSGGNDPGGGNPDDR